MHPFSEELKYWVGGNLCLDVDEIGCFFFSSLSSHCISNLVSCFLTQNCSTRILSGYKSIYKNHF